MFSFEKFLVYKKAQEFYQTILLEVIASSRVNYIIKDQLHRASLSISLNIAEGSGRYTAGEKRSFYTIARGSVHECVAIIVTLKNLNLLSLAVYNTFYADLTNISKMLSGLIKSFEKK